jgi:flavin-dependent dehydrogenase
MGLILKLMKGNKMTSHYDAIIVGGRNAGSSLAIRLAKQNLKVFLIARTICLANRGERAGQAAHRGAAVYMEIMC